MIELTRFNGETYFLNATHIESVEAMPDTIITLSNGKKHIVRDAAEVVVARITAFYQAAPMATVIPRLTDDFTE